MLEIIVLKAHPLRCHVNLDSIVLMLQISFLVLQVVNYIVLKYNHSQM